MDQNMHMREVQSEAYKSSQFQSQYTYQYPIEKKQDNSESINSEQSLSSIQEQQKYDDSAVLNYNYDEIVNQQQRLESQNISLQVPIQQFEFQPQDEPKHTSPSKPKLPSESMFLPFQVQPTQPQASVIERSFDGISAYTNISSKKRTSNRKKANTFYYDRIGNQVSEIMPPLIQNYFLHILLETLIPLALVLIIYVANYFIQKQINQFCYLPLEYCQCNGFGAKLWSWVRQLIMWKVGLIVYRKLYLCRLAMGQNNLTHKEPLTEYIILYLFTLGFDFILVVWIENNQDYVYVILAYCIGVVVLLNTFRVRDWNIVFRRGAGVFLYDVTLILLMVYIYYLIPNVIQSLQTQQGTITGMQSFFYLYPVIDLAMEYFIDFIFNQVQFAELYIYQLQLIILGIRVGILCLIEIWTFEFWYNILMLGIMRANNSSMFLTVFLRRWIYYLIPDLQFLTKMSETKKTIKGKHGAYLEHQFWIIFYYFFYLTKSSVPYIAKKTYLVTDCSFNNSNWDYTKEYYQPIVVWALLLVPEIVGIALNKSKKYDNIKYYGGCSFNIIENTFIRLSGYYFFQIAVMIPFLYKQINDLTKVNQHLTTVDTEQY